MSAGRRPGLGSGDTDARRWQRWAAEALVKVLALGDEERLPALRWVVKPGLDLVGHVPGDDPARMRTAFELWAATVGVEVYRTDTTEGVPGSLMVGQALFRVTGRHPLIRVTILAELPQVTR